MPTISPDLAEKARQTQIRNILAKLKSGKPLTAREQKIIDEASGKGQVARTYDQLAAILGISRKSLTRWRQNDPDGCPLPAPNGEHDVEQWRSYVANKDTMPDAEEIALKDQLLQEQIRKLKLANDAMEERYVALAEVIAAMRPTVLAIRTALDAMPNRIAIKLPGDYHDTVAVVEAEKNRVLRNLQGAAWFDESVEVETAAVDIDTADLPIVEGDEIKLPKCKPGRKKKTKQP
jgi:phage terminase Nu1 subunit (DNA packaging protein)